MLAQSGREIERMRLSRSGITKVLGPLENQPGGESRVFRVETHRGECALRLDFAQVLKDRAVAILIQDYLSRFGCTAKISGLFEGEVLKEFLNEHGSIDFRSPWSHMSNAPAYSAILMEIIVDGWNILQPERSRHRPGFHVHWDRSKIIAEVERVQNLATAIGVQIVDPQFLISSSGEVKIIDLDHWYAIARNGEYWGYHGLHTQRLKEWVPSRSAIRNDFVQKVSDALKEFGR